MNKREKHTHKETEDALKYHDAIENMLIIELFFQSVEIDDF